MAVEAHIITGAPCAKCGMPHLEEITTVALEHCAWAKAQSMTPDQVCQSIGVSTDRADWATALDLVAQAASAMRFDVGAVQR